MSKFRTIRKYTYLGLSVLTFGFILFQSAISEEESKKWENKVTDVWATVLNDGLNLKEKVSFTSPESVEFSNFSSYKGYGQNEIPIGASSNVEATVLPENVINRSVRFEAYPAENVRLESCGNELSFIPVKTGDVKIRAISNYDNSVNAEYSFSVVERLAPRLKDLNSGFTLKRGESKEIWHNFIDSSEIDCFDESKLAFSSNDESIVEFRGSYLKALDVGTTVITVTNGTQVITSNINVVENTEPIVSASAMEIVGEHIITAENINTVAQTLSVDWGINIPTDKNVIWSTDSNDPNLVLSSSMIFYNFQPDSPEEINFVIKATSVDNSSLQKEFNMTAKRVVSGDIELNESGTNFAIDAGSKISFAVENINYYYPPSWFEIKVGDDSVVSAYFQEYTICVVGLKEGNTTLVVSSRFNDSVTSKTLNIEVKSKGLINNDNREGFSFKVRKYFSGHAFLFMVATLFTGLFLHLLLDEKFNKTFTSVLAFSFAISLIFALTSEFIQLFITSRNASFSDVGIDLLGSVIGVGIVVIVLLIKNSIKKKKESKIIGSTK